MRISDWSSDVCSSDLLLETAPGAAEQMIVRHEHVVEGEFGGILRVQTDLLERAATGETFGVLGLAHHDRKAARAGLGLGSRDDRNAVRGLPVAHELLMTAHVIGRASVGERVF